MSIATENFLQAIQKRRTNYALSKDIKISDQRIQEIVEHCVKHVPSSFNSQAGRVKILLGGESDKFWQGTKEILRKIVPADAFAATEAKMNGFASGYGTILFFEDQDDVKKLQDGFPSYADNFPGWSEHSNGMLQFAVWTAFSNEGLGCSLQHYTPLVNELVETEWKAPKSWKLIAQMPFGTPVAPAGDKEFKPLETRLQVYGKSEVKATQETVKTTQETVKATASSNNATDNFLQAIQKRRTNYALSKDIKVSDKRIQEIVETSVKHVPSSFNSQAGRVKILLGRESDKFWEGTKEILRKIVPADAFAATEAKMNGFASGYGTILFFEDQDDVKKLQDGFPTYADNFPVWSEHSSGMLQFTVWTALSNEGLGCSLQHYTPLVNELVETEWQAPKSWKLIAQMPFGHPVAPAGDKEFKPLETRLQVYGKDSQKGKKEVQVTQNVAQVKGDGCCNIF